MIPFLAFVLPLTLYLSFPSTFWNFDGVACAAALELGQTAYLFHANHLLYGFFGFLFWKGIGLPIGLSRALPALQLFGSLLACGGLVGVYLLLRSVLKNHWSALLLTCGLATTAAFWVWSLEAQVYPLGFLFLAWATYVLIVHQGPRKYILVGLLHGAAVLGHVLHLVWTVPALYWIYDESRLLHLSVSKTVRHYLSALAIVVLLPYILVLELVITPGRDWAHILIWLRGSAGLTPDRSWMWHFAGWQGPWLWLKATLPVLWASFWPYGPSTVTTWTWIATFLSIATFLILLGRGWHHKGDRIARFSWIWLGVYGLFLSTWEPATYCYRMTDVLPLGILLALGLKTWKYPLQVILASLLMISTLFANLTGRIIPMHDVNRNRLYQEVLALSKITSPQSLYVTGGGMPWIYLLYFTGRSAWNAQSFAGPQLTVELRRQKKKRPLYLQEALLHDAAIASALKSFTLKPLEGNPLWLQVQ